MIAVQQFFYHADHLVNVGGCPGFLIWSSYRQCRLIFVHGSDIAIGNRSERLIVFDGTGQNFVINVSNVSNISDIKPTESV